MPHARVQVMRNRYTTGGKQLLPVGRGVANDSGAYRVFGLEPGRYYVSAIPQSQPYAMVDRSAVPGPEVGYVPV